MSLSINVQVQGDNLDDARAQLEAALAALDIPAPAGTPAEVPAPVDTSSSDTSSSDTSSEPVSEHAPVSASDVSSTPAETPTPPWQS